MSSSRHTHDYSLLLTFLLLNFRCYVIETQHLAILPRLSAGTGVKLKRTASASQDSLIGYNELKRVPLAQSYWSLFQARHGSGTLCLALVAVQVALSEDGYEGEKEMKSYQ